MRKLLIALSLVVVSTLTANAQEVYKEILNLSEKVANDKTKDIETRKIATFKVDELRYMAMKVREVMPDSTVTIIDRQAYALYDFINLYTMKIGEAKNKKNKETILDIFKAASIQNPWFNDMDLDLVESYIRNDGYITSFSLDTNWIKATEQARNELRKRGL